MRFLLLPFAFLALAVINPVRAEESDDDNGEPPPPVCGGCLPTGSGASSNWVTPNGGSVQITITLVAGACEWVALHGCMHQDCQATANVTWAGQPAGTTLTTPGGVATPLAGGGAANIPPVAVNCDSTLNYVATLSDGNSSTYVLKCSKCKQLP